jgi:hypothetical protein
MLGEPTWEGASVPPYSSSFSAYLKTGAASQESNGCWVNRREKERPFHTIRRHFPPTGKQRQVLRSRMDAGLIDVRRSVRSTLFFVIIRLLENGGSF